jgi:hypothetical protein
MGVHEIEPSGAVVPAGHGVQTNAPDVLEKVSTGHSLQEIDPGEVAKVPGVHGVHGSMPLGPKLPALHVASVVVVVTLLHVTDPAPDVVPAGHWRHDAEPLTGA